MEKDSISLEIFVIEENVVILLDQNRYFEIILIGFICADYLKPLTLIALKC
jgi:hypothetical protein